MLTHMDGRKRFFNQDTADGVEYEEDLTDGSAVRGTRIHVCVRLRPLIEEDYKLAALPKNSPEICVHLKSDGQTVKLTKDHFSTKLIRLDRTFDATCTQQEVYQSSFKMIVDEVISGFNGTGLVYGQTGSGKSHTMFGSGGDPGIVHLAVCDIFDCTRTHASKGLVANVYLSFYQLYLDQAVDLLVQQSDNQRTGSVKLSIREDAVRGAYVENLNEVLVEDELKSMKLLRRGLQNRHVQSTLYNIKSSRSHAILQIHMDLEETSCTPTTTEGSARGLDRQVSIRRRTLTLVDLAGSERVNTYHSKSKAHLREAVAINKSISSLGNCIQALAQISHQQSDITHVEGYSYNGHAKKVSSRSSASTVHIPYRDTKLTWLLAEPLGGNSKTCIIVNIGPCVYNYEDTKSTLEFAARARSVRKAVKKAEVEQLPFKEVRAVTTFEEQELRRRLSEPMLGGVAETHHRLARIVVRSLGGGRGEEIDDRQQHRSSQESDSSFDQNRSSINIHDIYSDELNNQIKHNLGDFLRSCQRSSFYGPLSPSIRYFSYDKGPATLNDSALKPRRRDSTAREDSILPNLYINEHLFVDAAVPGGTEDGSMASPVSEDSAADNEGTTDRHHDDGNAGDGDDGNAGDGDDDDDDRGKGVTGIDPDSNNDACSNIYAKDEAPCNNDVSTDERNDDAAVLDERNDTAVVKEEGNEGERIAEGDDAVVVAAGIEEVGGELPEELLLVDVDFDLPNMVQQLVPYRPATLSTSDLLNLSPTAAGDTGSDAAALQPYLNYRRKRVKEKLQHLESIDNEDYGGGDGDDKGGAEDPQSMRETIKQAVRGVGDLGATQKKYIWERGSGANYFDIEHAGSNIPTQKSMGHDRLDLEQLPRRPLTFILPAAPVDADEQWSGPYSYYSDHRHSNSNSLSPSKMKKVKEIYDEIELHNLSIYSATKSRARRAAQTSKYFEYSTSMVSNSAASMVSDSSTTAAEELTSFEPSTQEEIITECPTDINELDKSSPLPHTSASKSSVVVSSSSSRSSEKRKDLRSSLHNHGMGQIARHGSSSRRRNSSSIVEINGKEQLSIDRNKSIHASKNSKIDSRSNSTSSMVARSNSSRSSSVKIDHTADSRRSLGTGISQPVESGIRGLRPHVDDDGRKAKTKAKDADLLLVVQQLRASLQKKDDEICSLRRIIGEEE